MDGGVGRVQVGHVQLFAATADDPIRWRLLCRNNREAGRGVDSYLDAESCRIAVKELQLSVDELVASVRRSGATTWAWQLSRGDRVVVTSGNSYDRLIRCEQSLSQFRERFAEAEIGSGLMITQSRRWRTSA